MCGIVGYIGNKPAYPILIKGLKRLEYRGYDSAGITLFNEQLITHKKKGRVTDLEAHTASKNTKGTIGMGHTRWATHGEPNDINAHPHGSQNGHFVIIHNGIIENYSVLKSELIEKKYQFFSETDTEVLVNLIEYVYLQNDVSAEMAVRIALSKVIGAYGLVIICKDEPDQIIAARKGSPLVIGIGEGEHFIASDVTPIIEYTNKVVYMNDDDLAVVKRNELVINNLKNKDIKPHVQRLEIDLGKIEKGDFEHFMLKEIFEQPVSIRNTFRGRISREQDTINLGGLFEFMPRLINAKRMIIIGCGTSWHAGLVGEYLIEEFARIPVEVEYASEFRYRNPVLFEDDIVIVISQSGETADSLAAIQKANEAGALVLGICNVVGSSIPRETHGGVYTHAGPEIGVASTKAFTAQVTILMMLAMLLGRRRKCITDSFYASFISDLEQIPDKIAEILKENDVFKKIARKYKSMNNFLYLGRGYSFPVALEGALKLKEISYIHAEGYPAAEMKHGPIALIDEKMPVVFIAPKDESYDKIVSNMQEVKSRGGIIIAIVNEIDDLLRETADHIIRVPTTHLALMPLLTVIPLQLLSYHIAVMRGCNVDQPRNLAKSVTVE
jgi:glucosamine--fructose-6-phosphate aminotransferase (isomerizing)